MDDLIKVDEIKRQYELEKKDTLFDKPPERVAPPSEVEAAMQSVVGQAVFHKMKDEETQQKVLKTADKVIATELSKVENKAERDEKEAILQNNKDACDLYGIDEKTVPKWVVKGAKWVQNFYYFVWLLVGFFITAPVVFLGKKIKVVLKRTWVSMTVAIIIYLLIWMSPLIAEWLKKI